MEYPLEFTLESGTHVIINKLENKQFDFVLKPTEGETSHFAYDDNVEYTKDMEDNLDFDQLNALRRFWLERQKEEL